MTCKNCGAELNGNGICAYCGTVYKTDLDGILSFRDKEIAVYVSEVDYLDITEKCPRRDLNGRMMMPKRTTKRIFKVIER